MSTLTTPVLCLLTLAAGASAQPAVPTGHWEGAVKAPAADLKIEIDIAKDPQGQFSGTISVPDQQLQGLHLANFTRDKNSVAFQIQGAKGERQFAGDLSGDGQSISGTFTQNNYPMVFRLSRTGDPRVAPPTHIQVGKQLEGKWSSTVEANGAQSEFTLTLATGSESSIFNSADGLELPISNVAQDNAKVTLAIDAVGGSFSGSLNDSATELAGTWTQGPVSLPLTFHRNR